VLIYILHVVFCFGQPLSIHFVFTNAALFLVIIMTLQTAFLYAHCKQLAKVFSNKTDNSSSDVIATS